jgi:hypothetical protein
MTWQRKFLEQLGQEVKARGFDGTRPVDAIRSATASGHGIGKSSFVVWIMSTRPHCQGTVTANSFIQLHNREPALSSRAQRTWFSAAQSCREENSEAFAGQRAVTSTSFYLFDEASAIPDKILEVAEGGLTDGEAMESHALYPASSTALHSGRSGSVGYAGALISRNCTAQ